jgi:hypothetical protein
MTAAARIGMASAACAAAVALVPATALGAGLKVTATPALEPGFKTGTPDYVSRCKRGSPLRLSIVAPSGTKVSVDGAKAKGGSFTANVPVHASQGTTLRVVANGKSKTYHVRCLPSDFPTWRYERAGTPKAQWYLFAPTSGDGKGPYIYYAVLMDARGVPVWWRRQKPSPFNAGIVSNTTLAWTRWYADPFGMRDTSAWELHTLDGKLVRVLKTVGTPTDTHDMKPLANGDFMLLSYRLRAPVDLTPYGRSGTGGVFDGELQEIGPTGAVVWQWNSHDWVAPSETTERPPPAKTRPDGRAGFDVFHLNAVAPDGHGGFVISSRHTNALYRIDATTHAITWKLGGTNVTGESLAVRNDPLSPHLVRQHDVSVLPDGTITAYDNRSHVGRPRAVRFAVDPLKHTATLLGQVTEAKVSSSGAEGSARMIGGDWVVSWGGSHVMSELTGSGKLVWRTTFEHDTINYRITPIAAGRIAATALRRGMDAMNPRP